MNHETRQRYLAWRRRRVLKRVGLPALILATFIFGFIWGRNSVTIPEPEIIECPEPVVCELQLPTEVEDDDLEDDDDDEAAGELDDQELEPEPEVAEEPEPEPEWDQP